MKQSIRLVIEMANPLLESFGEPPWIRMTNSSRPLTDLKGKGNPDLPSVCSNYWPSILALSLCVMKISPVPSAALVSAPTEFRTFNRPPPHPHQQLILHKDLHFLPHITKENSTQLIRCIEIYHYSISITDQRYRIIFFICGRDL